MEKLDEIKPALTPPKLFIEHEKDGTFQAKDENGIFSPVSSEEVQRFAQGGGPAIFLVIEKEAL